MITKPRPNPFDWSAHKLQQNISRTKSWIWEKALVSLWAKQSVITSPWISIQPKLLWILLQRRIWQKNFRAMHWMWCIFVPCKRTRLFSKISFLADCKRYLFIKLFCSNGIVKVLIKHNKDAKHSNYVFQWNVQKHWRGVFCKRVLLEISKNS